MQFRPSYLLAGASLPLDIGYRLTVATFTLQHHAAMAPVPLNTTVIQVCASTNNTEENEVEWFTEDPQNLLELTPPKNVLFIIEDWNAKVESQEILGVTGKFGLEYRIKHGKG